MTEGDTLLEHAELLLARRKVVEASAALNRAEQLGAASDRCSSARWLAAMLVGDFMTAWNESDRIRARGEVDPHRFWGGENLAGKRVIVRCLHGFGDAVQMLRYAPLLAKRAAHVVYEVPPRMVELATLFHGVHDVITWGEEAPRKQPLWDVQVEVMELPYIFRTHIDHLPIAQRYLEVPIDVSQRAAKVMGDAEFRRIGIVWTGGEWNRDRAIPFSILKPLTEIPGIEFWNLQGGPAREEAGTMMRDATHLCGDGLLTLAAVMHHLDLVITVDTLAAHLAGAMGKPVWVMLQHAADWRWMVDRDDSRWYPTMRLFRQSGPGDWAGVVNRVCTALQTHICASTR